MIEWNIALGAAVIMAALCLGAALSRWYVTGSGAHRAVEETVPLAELMRPQTAEVNDVGWCPAEQRETLHAYERMGRRCWDCRHYTPVGGAS